ncbi:hypothetical protein, partial [Paraburkholderia sp. SIMBA_030]|uniref:hypothetical protein n=1 Tax=Paraburkholderia sp. SIMBA_030 TaxID=3085773 RepID=UPI00397C754F
DGDDAIVASTIGLRWSADWPQGDLPVTVSGMFGWRRLAGYTGGIGDVGAFPRRYDAGGCFAAGVHAHMRRGMEKVVAVPGVE